jgi:hypothetical protein
MWSPGSGLTSRVAGLVRRRLRSFARAGFLANAQVLAADGFNDPPEPGKQFFIATVRATRTGESPERFFASVRFRALGPSGVLLAAYSASNACGVIPNGVPFGPVVAGASISGNVCWEAPSADVGSLVMFDDYASDKSKRVWFKLTP